METLASFLSGDTGNLLEVGPEPPCMREPEGVFSSPPPAGAMWTEELYPQIQRNKQLQDTLLQREEELSRLQEENLKLREFLNSSFVRSLEEKAKKLSEDGRRRLKRSSMQVDEEDPPQISKRVCKNLTAEFCSGTSSTSEPNLDLWVLRTLGLKDPDTIDESSPGFHLRSLVYNSAVTSSPAHVHPNICPTFTANEAPEPEAASRTYLPTCRTSAGGPTTSRRSQEFHTSGSSIRSYDSSTALHLPQLAKARTFPQHPSPSGIFPPGHPTTSDIFFPGPPTTSDLSSSGPFAPSDILSSGYPDPARALALRPSLARSPLLGALGAEAPPTSTSTGQPEVQEPGRTELAFSMSLSMSTSVKTHSFPQGQAFVRRDTGGRWNFTWVPSQRP